MTSYATIGQSTPLIEGEAKVTGKTRFGPDLQLPGLLHGRLVTSPHAHARILSIDTGDALAIPGVVAVMTAQDLPQIEPSNRQRLLLARDRVIFAGQPVAFILAEDLSAAQDAVDLVYVDYEPLPAAITLEEALAPDAPLVWPSGKPGESEDAASHGADVGGDEKGDTQRSNVANQSHFERGDVTKGFTEADVVLERQFSVSMVHQNPMETHSCTVQIDPFSEQVTVWSATQGPFNVRQQVAEILDITESDVRCIATPLGGGFGAKGVLYEPLTALAARILGRPIKLILSRYEELVATIPTPPGKINLKLGAKKDGTLTTLQGSITFNGGCYPSSPLGISMLLIGSLYQIENVDLVGKEVLSFKPSSGAYRAPGVPQGTFAMESMVDDVAQALGIDPFEFRLKNASKPGDPMIHGEEWPRMGMTEVLEALQDHPIWQNREAARAAGRGVGIAVGGWLGGTGPASAACGLDRDGVLNVQLGSVDISGVNTGFMMMAAEAFGISPDKIKIGSNDTAGLAFGLNAGGSKITYTVGPALVKAAQEARRQTLEIAADMMEANEADLEIVDNQVQVKGVPDRSLSLAEIAGKTMQFGGIHPPILGHGRHAVVGRSPGFSAQLAEVEVDAETGSVEVHNLIVVQDVGKALNPLLVQGQMMGGATQGVGWALYESMAYDDYGQPISASWMDYTVPHIHQGAKSMETILVEVPSDQGPYGAKGVGEPPVTPTAGAIANAIQDAIGARVADLPMTPARIMKTLNG
ncbi:MAG: xanthine dehydrogenase family protein molybdopterin-binding subunit [Chloroflexota bacterium]